MGFLFLSLNKQCRLQLSLHNCVVSSEFSLLSCRHKEGTYSKTCPKRPLKKDKTKILMTDGSLMKVESISECSPMEHSAILVTCIKR